MELGTEVGRYRIDRKLGQGGMGAVYLGVQPAIGSQVAIKILSEQCASDPDLVERFFAEARAVNLIRHDSIVDILDLARLPDGRPYIIMEYVAGQTLGHIIRHTRAPLGGIASALAEVLSALDAAHAIGIIHRDLKPDNILISAKGYAKVLDFGIAKLARGLQSDLAPRTHTGALLGTPAYMSPEQIANAAVVDGRSDIYAAGIVLFEAVTGRRPFTGSTFELMRAHAQDPPPPPRSLRADLPLAFEQVIATALEKDPDHRFASAGAMATALQRATRELPRDQQRMLSLVEDAAQAPSVMPSVPSSVAPPVMTPSVVAPSVVAPSVVAPSMVAPSVVAPSVVAPSVVAPSVVAPSVVAPSVDAPPVVAPSVAAPIRRRFRPLVAIVIALAACVITFGIVAALRSRSSTAEGHDSGPAAPDRPARTGSSVGPRADMDVLAAKADPRHFDVDAYIVKAESVARVFEDDARLVEIRAVGVGLKGLVDLTRPGETTQFVFVSERARRSGGSCRIVVTMRSNGSPIADHTTGACTEAPVPHPRCPLSRAILATPSGFPSTVTLRSTAHYTAGARAPVWRFETPLSGQDSVVDDGSQCPEAD